ncbi:hypothetical protein XHV734_3964 [Xanthomonas hortorum pv. vitians]|nr:hypothetical protein XHV734_3964 [Xanthomonas hortorum pv. vitians]
MTKRKGDEHPGDEGGDASQQQERGPEPVGGSGGRGGGRHWSS